MDPGFAQDNPGIAQIHALRVTYISIIAACMRNDITVWYKRSLSYSLAVHCAGRFDFIHKVPRLLETSGYIFVACILLEIDEPTRDTNKVI